MIFIPNNQQYMDLQHAYNDLHSKYITATSTLQYNLNLLASLQTQLEKVKSENNSLKNILRTNKLHSDQISQQQQQEVKDIEVKKELEVKKEQNQLKKPIRHVQIPKANFTLKLTKIFKCPYQNCSKSYERKPFLSTHIQSKHKGGTKAQRQAFAKAMLQAIQKGEKLPMHKNITLPPNFLIEFRKTYQSQKRQDI